ncbi:DUF1853 family protein [uncultured Endozoicomonas sp.]|uniref:DUF1853 family protein n=1 Tax=uncultured Endozoicomonas sp. TaxID=432652 RepID=UPI00261A7573|nr:DUF1853 family protein [uncultured Endozoicomonas sp.]
MHEFSHQILKHTLHQALHWIQSAPPIFCSDAHPLCVDRPLPHNLSPIVPNTEQHEALASRLIEKGNPLLGMFYETLWQFLLDELPNTQLLAHNRQVNQVIDGRKTTLGEFDLIYRHQQRVFHRELAVKFYLGVPDQDNSEDDSPWNQWVGPGLKDRLDRKMNHLLQHQVTLGETTAGRESFKALNARGSLEKEALIQGRLFYPLSSYGHCPAPQFSNPEHLKGTWLTVNELHSWAQLKDGYEFQLPAKREWLNETPLSTLYSHNELQHRLSDLKQPLYVLACHQSLPLPLHVFIVPDHWPTKALSASRL